MSKAEGCLANTSHEPKLGRPATYLVSISQAPRVRQQVCSILHTVPLFVYSAQVFKRLVSAQQLKKEQPKGPHIMCSPGNILLAFKEFLGCLRGFDASPRPA